MMDVVPYNRSPTPSTHEMDSPTSPTEPYHAATPRSVSPPAEQSSRAQRRVPVVLDGGIRKLSRSETKKQIAGMFVDIISLHSHAHRFIIRLS